VTRVTCICNDPILLACVYMPVNCSGPDCLENYWYTATCCSVSALIAECDIN